MHVFIDDSGDPAFKLAQGSTRYFVIACAIFFEDVHAEKASVAIEKYKRDLNFGQGEELKFNKSSKKVRIKFLKSVANLDFVVRAIVVDKSFITSEYLKSDNKSMYNFAIKEVLNKSSHLLIDARVKIDGRSGRLARQALNNYIRSQVNTQSEKSIKNVKLVNSHSNNLIQLADMLAGAIRRSFEETDADIYKAALYEITSKDGSDIWKFK